jgi:site-specific DNA recombinase
VNNLEIIQEVISGLKRATELGQTPVFLFDRISDKANESKSLEFQDAHSKRYVAEKNLCAVYHFSVTESGWKAQKRRIFNQMLDIAEKFGIKDLVFKNSDRLSRNVADIIRIRELLEQKDYRIHFFENHQVVDKHTNYSDNWNLQLMILLAQRHSDKNSHDGIAANKYKTEKGIAPGKARLGYVYDKQKREHLIDRAQESTVRWIFDEFDSGKHSLTDFVDLVNARGIKNVFGRKWQKSRLHELLTNPFYHGEFVTKKDKSVHQGNHQGYYDKERYLQRVERLGARYFPRKGGDRDFLLSNLVRCSCGAKYYGSIQKERYVYYEHPCKHLGGKHDRLSEAALLGLIDAEIAKTSFTDAFVAYLKETLGGRVRERNANNQEDLLILSNKLLELNRKKNRLFELYTEEAIDKHDLTARIQDYDKEIAQLKKHERSISMDQQTFIFSVAGVIEDFKNFTRIYALSKPENKASLLRASLEKITKDGLNITFEFREKLQVLYKPELLALQQGVRVHTAMRGWRDLNPWPSA